MDQQLDGECCCCGICCHSDAYILQEDNISSWFELHGYDAPMKCEQMANVLIKKLDKNRVKIIFFDRCKNLAIDSEGKSICLDYENRPTKCRNFPSTKEECFNIAECSFNKGNK